MLRITNFPKKIVILRFPITGISIGIQDMHWNLCEKPGCENRTGHFSSLLGQLIQSLTQEEIMASQLFKVISTRECRES